MCKINEGKLLARRLMDQHGLTTWKIVVDRAKKRFGLCKHSVQTISISERHFSFSSHEDIVDTILHEIAHALVGPGHGHNHVWKAKCRQIGAKPIRCGKKPVEAYNADAKWTATCCGSDFKRYRRPKGRYFCKKCRQTIVWQPT